MGVETIKLTPDQYNECRKALWGKLPAYLKAEGELIGKNRLRCFRCSSEVEFKGDFWQCGECGAVGEPVTAAAALHPELDDFDRFRYVFGLLGLPFPFLRTVEAEELMDMDFPVRHSLVEGLLGQGVYLLAGAAKIGKSWLALDLADHVSRGEPFWGRRVEQGAVLYLSLEDTYERLQSRLCRVADASPGPVVFCTDCARAGEGLEEQLRRQAEDRPELRLIIVDTLQKVRRTSTENYSYSADYEVISAFKRLADEKGLTVLIVHLTRKEEAGDAMNMVSGTMGLNGAADGTLVLWKPARVGSGAFLQVTGRDLPDQRLRLELDRETMRWRFLGAEEEADGPADDPLLLRLLAFVREEGDFEGTASELLARLGLEGELSPVGFSRRLRPLAAALEDRGAALRFSRGSKARLLTLRRMG